MEYENISLMDKQVQGILEIDEKMTNLEIFNDTISFFTNIGAYIEFKSCQKLINTGQKKYPIRKGTFNINFEKHRQLILNQGFYIFIVFNEQKIIHWKMIKASDLYFQKRIMWNRLFME